MQITPKGKKQLWSEGRASSHQVKPDLQSSLTRGNLTLLWGNQLGTYLSKHSYLDFLIYTNVPKKGRLGLGVNWKERSIIPGPNSYQKYAWTFKARCKVLHVRYWSHPTNFTPRGITIH